MIFYDFFLGVGNCTCLHTPFWADAPGNRRGKLERAEGVLAMPHIMIR